LVLAAGGVFARVRLFLLSAFSRSLSFLLNSNSRGELETAQAKSQENARVASFSIKRY
jgi:hypothetical protein